MNKTRTTNATPVQRLRAAASAAKQGKIDDALKKWGKDKRKKRGKKTQ